MDHDILFGLMGELASPWHYFGIGLTSVMGTIFSVTLYLHRSQAHGAVRFHPIVAHLMRFWLWFTTGMVTKEWVAIHRKHHAFTDKEGDPHTPVGKRWWQVLFLVREYVWETRNKETVERYGRGTPDDWIEHNLYARHPLLGIVLGASLAVILFGVLPGGLIAIAHALWIPFWAAFVVNGLGHLFGYRNCDTPDNSRNTCPFFFFAIWIGGEELHNNHHAYPTSAKFSMRWFECDIGWGVIWILSQLGLATKIRRAPVLRLDRSKTECDHTTLDAILKLRFEVLRRFDRAASRAKRYHGERVDRLLCIKRKKLEALWSSRYLGKEELLLALRLWWIRTRESDLLPLREFARQLPWYTLK